MTSTYDRYKSRPQGEEFDDLCLASFCSEYRVLCKSELCDVESKQHRNPIHKLQNNLGYVQKRSRTKPAVIRYAKFSESKEAEKHYQSTIQLFLPHKEESQLKPPQFDTFKHFYETGSVKYRKRIQLIKDIVEANRAKFEFDAEALERAGQALESGCPHEDACAQICPETELERLSTIEKQKDKNTDPQEDKDIPDLLGEDKKQYSIDIRQSVGRGPKLTQIIK